jgi:hypothetical protein
MLTHKDYLRARQTAQVRFNSHPRVGYFTRCQNLGSVFTGPLVRGYETFEMLLQNPVQPSRGWFLLSLLTWLVYHQMLLPAPCVVSAMAFLVLNSPVGRG